MPAAFQLPVSLAAYGCTTAFGDAAQTYAALCEGRRALELRPVLGREGGDLAPMALCPGRSLDESAPPNWMPFLRDMVASLPQRPWGSARFPVYFTSSNFGVGSLYAFRRTQEPAHLKYGTPSTCVEWLRTEFGWGENFTTFSHACVSAHLGIMEGSRALHADLADEVLVLSFDFLSPFVAGGFNALKILNAEFPAPYEDRANGSIGLGDGAAFAVLSRDKGPLRIVAQSLHNEMYHFTANQSDGTGFAACIEDIAAAAEGKRVWVKGHGTGTLEAGRLEATALARAFPGAPLVSWKGSLGHTLGSCGAVELSIVAESLQNGTTPGTVGSKEPGFTPELTSAPFSNLPFDGVVCASNAFGGAHAAMLVVKA